MPTQKMTDRICTCGHDKSVHAYSRKYSGSVGRDCCPRKCGVPKCRCRVFVSRRTMREAKEENRWHDYMAQARRDAGLKPVSHAKLMGDRNG